MKDHKRGTRRARTQAKADNRILKGYWGSVTLKAKSHDHVLDARERGKLRDNPQICSCRACGNQRYWEGQTLDELSHAQLNKRCQE